MKHDHFKMSLIDLLLNISVTFVALFMLAVISMNDPVKQKDHNADEQAKVMIVMTWDDNSADDLDLWLLTPEPAKIGYNAPNGAIANLERDDLGKTNDFTTEGHVKHYVHLNREVLTIRTLKPGHYVVNVEFYQRKPDPERNNTLSVGPVAAKVSLISLDPHYNELAYSEVALPEEGAERTAVSFDVDSQGNVRNVDTTTQQPFVYQDVAAQEGFSHG